MKNKIITIVFSLVFITGLSLCIYGIFDMYQDNHQQEEVIEITKEELKNNLTDEKKEEKKPIDAKTKIDELPKEEFKKTIKEGTYGLLTIPSINVEVAVSLGITDNVLNYFAGVYPVSEMPGTIGGNTAIAAHSMIPGYKVCPQCYFDEIGDIPISGVIELMWHDGYTYKYKVVETHMYEDIAADYPFNKIEDKSLLTLVTCTNGDSNYRTYVIAEMVDKVKS